MLCPQDAFSTGQHQTKPCSSFACFDHSCWHTCLPGLPDWQVVDDCNRSLVNTTWTKKSQTKNATQCSHEPKRTRCIGHTVLESPLTKKLQHLLGTSAGITKVRVPGIQEEIHPMTSRHQVSQPLPGTGRLLVFKDDVTTQLRPAKQRSMKQHPLQQTYKRPISPSSSLPKKNILRMYILRTKSTHIAQSLDVSSKNRDMAINRHLLSCNDNSNTIRKMIVCNLQTFKLTVTLSRRNSDWLCCLCRKFLRHTAHFRENSQSSDGKKGDSWKHSKE